MWKQLVVLVWVAPAVAIPFERNHSEPRPLDFDYQPFSVKGPLGWRYLNVTGHEWEQYVGLGFIDLDVPNNECKSTRRPSPINLVANAECMDTHEILTRRIAPNDCRMDSLEFALTPHTLRATFPNNDEVCTRPTIDLPNGYPYRWFAHHVEIHIRAEHVVDGRRYDGEMQMYHLGQEDQRREMATVSVLLDASGFEDNPRLQEYIDRWLEVESETKTLCASGRRLKKKKNRKGRRALRSSVVYGEFFIKKVDTNSSAMYPSALEDPEHAVPEHLRRLEEMVPRRKMFPYDIWPTIYFYRYKGSITTPPCSEIISWRVLDEPLVISRKQLNDLARLLRDYVDPETCKAANRLSNTDENFRPLQTHNHERQELVHCTEKNFGFELYPASVA